MESLSTDISETVGTMLSKTMFGGSSIGKGISMPVPEKGDEEEITATLKSRSETKSKAESESEEEAEGNAAAGANEENEANKSNGASAVEVGENSDSGGEQPPQEISETEGGRIPIIQTSEASVAEGGTVEKAE